MRGISSAPSWSSPGLDPRRVAGHSIIDGQQRLTTLLLLFDAAAATLEAAGYDKLAAQLDQLTHNGSIFVISDGTRLKLRHSNKDREAFDEVMDAEAPVDHAG